MNDQKDILSTQVTPTFLGWTSIDEESTSLGVATPQYNIIIGDKNADNSLHVDWKKFYDIYFQNQLLLNFIPTHFNSFYAIKKENLLLTGIKNLRKNIRFLQLTKELATNIINDEEFEAEIEKNPNNFLIDIHLLEDPLDAVLLHDIVNKIGEELTIDEAGDIFSFDSESIKEHLNKLSK
jgi:hypothetical protein